MRLLFLTSLAMIAFAANSVLTRMAVGSGEIDPLGFALVRLIVGAVVLLMLVALRAGVRGGRLWPGNAGRVVGALALMTYLVGFSLAYAALDAGVGALILFGMVQITMFAGAFAAREAVPGRRWAGAGVAFAGLVVLMLPGGAGVSLLHAGWMALAGIGWGIYSLAGRGQADALGATAWNFALAVPLGLLVLRADMTAATGTGIGLAVLSGAVSSGLGYALWYAVLPQLGAARAAVAQLTVPLLAALGGVVLLGEGLGLRFGLAAVLVLGGVAVALVPRRG